MMGEAIAMVAVGAVVALVAVATGADVAVAAAGAVVGVASAPHPASSMPKSMSSAMIMGARALEMIPVIKKFLLL
jgi:hypothetical protein